MEIVGISVQSPESAEVYGMKPVCKSCKFVDVHCSLATKELLPCHYQIVMGDDSCSRGRGFESQHHILDGHDIFTLIYF